MRKRNWKICAFMNAVVVSRTCPEGALVMMAFPTKGEAERLVQYVCALSRLDNTTYLPPKYNGTPEGMQWAFYPAYERMRKGEQQRAAAPKKEATA